MDEERRTQSMENIEEEDVYSEDVREETYHDREPVDQETEEEVREREHSDGASEREEVREGASTPDGDLIPLLAKGEAENFRSRWFDIQTDFIDDPRHSVESADELVAQVINSITENFASERDSLEDQWNRGEEASTEDLRLAIKRYRSFFNRLLTLESADTEQYG